MRWKRFFRRQKEDGELELELQSFLEEEIEDNLARGLTETEARRKAIIKMGNARALRERHWEHNTPPYLTAIVRDTAYACRTLLRTPAFTLIAVAIMALGIGANVALFTAVRKVLLTPLPFSESKQLVSLYSDDGKNGNIVSAADFYDWQRSSTCFEQMALWRWTGYNMAGEREELPEFLNGVTASWNLFSTLRVQPVYGRTFTQADDQLGSKPVVLLSWTFFQRRFHGDASIVGKEIRLNARPYTVLGIMPRSFNYPDPKAQLWTPYRSDTTAVALANHFAHTSYVVARLKPDASLVAARQELNGIQYGLYEKLHALGPMERGVLIRPLIDDVVSTVRTSLYVLMAAVSCLLLIACLNLSNLLIARGASRKREFAIRAALGGSRIQLFRQQLIESLLLCFTSSLLGLLIAYVALQAFIRYWSQLPRTENVHLDLTAVVLSLGIGIVTGILSGLLPAFTATAKELTSALQDGAKTVGASTKRATLRRALLTVELTLSMILLLCGGLLFKSFLNLRSTDLGCTTHNVLTLHYFLRGDRYSQPEQVANFQKQLLDRVRQLPGVSAAGLTNVVPGGGYYSDTEVWRPERPPTVSGMYQFARTRTADPDYFTTLQIPLLRGRFFSNKEQLTNDRFVIVNEKFAQEFFPGEEPVGKHIQAMWQSAASETYEIIGVVGNTRHLIDKPVRSMMWFPIFSGLPGKTRDTVLVVRSARNVLGLTEAIQKTLAGIDPDLPVSSILTLDQIIGKATSSSEYNAGLFLIFAAIALFLAGAGLYGVLSYMAEQRTVEIGLRIALGENRGQLLRRMMYDGLRPALAGLVIGSIASVVIARFIQSILYETQPLDISVFMVVSFVLIFVSSLACVVPAWQASRLDPMRALRME